MSEGIPDYTGAAYESIAKTKRLRHAIKALGVVDELAQRRSQKFARGELRARILEAAKSKAHVTDIASAVGGRLATVASVITKLKKEGKLKAEGKGWYRAVANG